MLGLAIIYLNQFDYLDHYILDGPLYFGYSMVSDTVDMTSMYFLQHVH